LLIRKHDFLQQIHLCAVVHYFNWIGLAVSGLSLTMLNIDKLIYFRWPLNYDRSMSKRRAALFCLLIWGLSVGFISYCWLFNIVYIHSFDCSLQMSPGRKFYYEIFLILFCVLPVTSSLIVSIYLFNLTRQKRNAGSGGDTSAFKNKIINPLITSLIYAPYRMTIKKFLVNIPVGNRPFYNYQGEQLHLDSRYSLEVALKCSAKFS
uniref:G_PROTEIN_RECEP_F1_2 domain-containing protein n=1 Tax=Heligmosomoides polygyrus TaxID=6339 RepID=A0A183F2U1_HELPZ